jgi:hypothetical protein
MLLGQMEQFDMFMLHPNFIGNDLIHQLFQNLFVLGIMKDECELYLKKLKQGNWMHILISNFSIDWF